MGKWNGGIDDTSFLSVTQQVSWGRDTKQRKQTENNFTLQQWKYLTKHSPLYPHAQYLMQF